MRDMGNREGVLLCLSRMRYLRVHEKILFYDMCSSAEEVAALGKDRIQELIKRKLDAHVETRDNMLFSIERDAELCRKRGIDFVSVFDGQYPPQLRELFNPPFVLYYKGELPAKETELLAIVGTRRASSTGLDAAYNLAYQAAECGVAVVSGLARGIDRAAHKGAVEGGGETCGVLAHGPDTVYPQGSRGIAAEMLKMQGGLISEYPPGTEARKYHFPERNRIISGLSRAVVIIEAPQGSGALITSEFALDQGRDVFVHSACTGLVNSTGTQYLSREGAQEVSDMSEILSTWGYPAVRRSIPNRNAKISGRNNPPNIQMALEMEKELEHLVKNKNGE